MFGGKEFFCDKLKCELDMHSVDYLVLCLGDFNGHVSIIDEFYGVHGENGAGHLNLEERMLLEFYLEKELCVSNTWFKTVEKRKVTFKIGSELYKK